MSAVPQGTYAYLILPNDGVEEISDNGDSTGMWAAPGLYRSLVDAGYPEAPWDGAFYETCLDVLVHPADPTTVWACTQGEPPHEHDMGEASEVFLAWYRTKED